MRSLAVVALAFAALAAPAAGAEAPNPDRYDLGWRETMRVNGRVAMTFRVMRVHFQYTAWAAEVEFRNRWTKPITIRKQFALLLGKTRDADANFSALVAKRAGPRALPKVLKPGQRWVGVLSGPGRPRTGAYVRLNFGYFIAPGLFPDSDGFAWVTDHVFQVQRKA